MNVKIWEEDLEGKRRINRVKNYFLVDCGMRNSYQVGKNYVYREHLD